VPRSYLKYKIIKLFQKDVKVILFFIYKKKKKHLQQVEFIKFFMFYVNSSFSMNSQKVNDFDKCAKLDEVTLIIF